MSRTSWLFLLGVVLPSLLLAWLSWRSIEQQQVVVEGQAAVLYESETLALSEATREAIFSLETIFRQRVTGLSSPFDATIGSALAEAIPGAIGFVIDDRDGLLLPTTAPVGSDSSADEFLRQNAAFLQADADVVREVAAAPSTSSGQVVISQRAEAEPAKKERGRAAVAASKLEYANVQQLRRQSEPELALDAMEAPAQAAAPPAEPPGPDDARRSEFLRAVGNSPEGMLARFHDGGTELFLWQRMPGGMLAGCALPAAAIADWLAARLPMDTERTGDYTLGLLDERGVLKWSSRPGETPPGSPFVRTPVGDPLPLWEAVLWLTDPSWLARNATFAKWTIALLTLVSLSVILLAGYLMLHAARRQLELARRKSDFVSSVSHELKTPLTSIRMFAELMQQPSLPEEKRSRFSGIISEECERLSRLVGNVLTFSRLERGTLAPPATCHLHEVVERVVARQTDAMEAVGCQVEIKEGEDLEVAMDSDEVEQILLNLLNNAEKYASGTRIEIHLSQQDSMALLTVRDHGPGIPPGREASIFEAFERAVDSLTSERPGAGLGLAICARLLADRRGSISCHNHPEGGAVFVCRFPLAVKPSQP